MGVPSTTATLPEQKSDPFLFDGEIWDEGGLGISGLDLVRKYNFGMASLVMFCSQFQSKAFLQKRYFHSGAGNFQSVWSNWFVFRGSHCSPYHVP